MATTITSKNKWCGNCEYWSGKREFTSNTRKAIRIETNEKGKCYEKRIDKQAMGGCPDWIKWGALNEE
jgi:hypothetical protein